MSALFHDLRVKSIEPDTSEASILSFEVPPELRETFGFTQGQYLTLRASIDGQDLRRSYSICAGVDDGELRVGVRRVKGGVFSNWINERVKPGDTISVMAPQGRFFVPIEPESCRHHVGIAGGSGITPILSIMKTVLAREPKSRFTLIYGNRMLRSTMFKEEIEDLKNRYITRLSLQHVFSDEPTDSPINMGVMNRDKIGEFLATVVPAPTIDHAYVCGPFQMNDEAEAALVAAGVPEAAIHIERFGVAHPKARPPAYRSAPWCMKRSQVMPNRPRWSSSATACGARSTSARISPASSTPRRRLGWKCLSPVPRVFVAPAGAR
jgi:ring-1,2-phenylacetyl-CoA epoxidase subunit PaaE